jgi:hypothetical protein
MFAPSHRISESSINSISALPRSRRTRGGMRAQHARADLAAAKRRCCDQRCVTPVGAAAPRASAKNLVRPRSPAVARSRCGYEGRVLDRTFRGLTNFQVVKASIDKRVNDRAGGQGSGGTSRRPRLTP